MPDHVIHVPAPPPVCVAWACVRCGFTGGTAKTAIPIDPQWSERMGRVLLDALRQKLVQTHQRLHGCVATPSDFRLRGGRPPGRDVLGRT